MPYSNSTQVELTLAQALTSANPSSLTSPVKLATIGTRVSPVTIPPDEFNFFISQADAIINAALSQQYAVPLTERCDLSMRLLNDVSEYTDTISIDNYADLTIGDTLVITDGTNQDRLVVASLESTTSFTVDTMPVSSYVTGARILRIKFPDPITFISARLAAANIYDKHLKAQTDPGKSDYGDTLRKMATKDLNNIREGRTIIDAPRIGWRFANPNLVSRYTVKGVVEQDSTLAEPNE